MGMITVWIPKDCEFAMYNRKTFGEGSQRK